MDALVLTISFWLFANTKFRRDVSSCFTPILSTKSLLVKLYLLLYQIVLIPGQRETWLDEWDSSPLIRFFEWKCPLVVLLITDKIKIIFVIMFVIVIKILSFVTIATEFCVVK